MDLVVFQIESDPKGPGYGAHAAGQTIHRWHQWELIGTAVNASGDLETGNSPSILKTRFMPSTSSPAPKQPVLSATLGQVRWKAFRISRMPYLRAIGLP